MTGDSFPQQYARTQRLSLGEPRNISVSSDGKHVLFLRSGSGSDSINKLWMLDVESGHEKLVADPNILLGNEDAENLPPEERARRERLREGAGGITSFNIDRHGHQFVFTLSGRLFCGDLRAFDIREVKTTGSVFDPRIARTGNRIAHVSGKALRVVDLAGEDFELVGPTTLNEPEHVSWGAAEFVAAEEMNRYRGYWWAPSGHHIAACRVDESPIDEWFIADPANTNQLPFAIPPLERTMHWCHCMSSTSLTRHELPSHGTLRHSRISRPLSGSMMNRSCCRCVPAINRPSLCYVLQHQTAQPQSCGAIRTTPGLIWCRGVPHSLSQHNSSWLPIEMMSREFS